MNHDRPYKEFFEQSPDAILIIEGDQFVDCNPAAVRMLRFADKRELLERAHPGDISPPRQPCGRSSYEKAEEKIAIAFERGSHLFEWVHLTGDGEEFLVEVQLTVVESSDKPVIHVVWRDISARKRLEKELRRAQRLEAVGRLAGGVAHDFNNLLSVVLSHTELLDEEFASGEPDPLHVAEIRYAAERASALTRQLLAFSRGQPAQSRPTDLGELAERFGGLLRRLIGEHIELRLARDDGPLTVVADPSQLEQLVVNLAANARDAMPEGGKLRIATRRHHVRPAEATEHLPAGDYVALRVTDSGTGMTPDQLDRAFDPFYTTKELGKGTGLGLATVYAIAEQHGGHASIESAPQRGTTVEVLLPLSDLEPAPLQESSSAAPSAGGGGETILLVEDERAIRDLFEEGLTAGGYRVHTAADGQEALEWLDAQNGSIDMLVTDVVMPRLSGPELVRRLSHESRRLPVVFMSGYSEDDDLNVTSHQGPMAVLQKPFTAKKLQSEIRRILDQQPAC